MKTIEQQMQNIQHLIPYKLSCALKKEKERWEWDKETNRLDKSFVLFINGELNIEHKQSIHMQQNATNDYRNYSNNNGPKK